VTGADGGVAESPDVAEILDALTTRVWPPARVVMAGPWQLRACGGFTGRANSVAVLGAPSAADLPGLFAAAADFYAAHDLPVRFQVAEVPRTEPVRQALTDRGFRPDVAVHVMVHPAPGDVAAVREVNPLADGVACADDPDPAWVDTWWELFPRGEAVRGAGLDLLARIPAPRTFATLPGPAGPGGVGLGTVADGWVELGAIGVRPAARERGAGRGITAALLRWGVARGATAAFLQVTAGNAPAIAVYRRLGFEFAYDYRYWE
jgi:N-acetylglutamate synthase